MSCFMWLAGGDLPPAYDLRRRGWSRVARTTQTCGSCGLPALLSDRARIESLSTQFGPGELQRIVMLGIPQSQERARLLRLGLGDALDHSASLEEIDARAAHVIRAARQLPAYREHGPLTLDLFLRDGFVTGRRLGLHPREFALLWRLAAQPGKPVSSNALLAEVWHLTLRPETNSLAVHVYRLRQKLRAAGFTQWVRTVGSEGYMLAPLPSADAAPAMAELRGALCVPSGRV